MKDQTNVQCHNLENLSNCLCCQRPFSRTNFIPKNTSPCLWCQTHSQLQKPNPRTPLNLPVMLKFKLKYKGQTSKYLSTCLWFQIPILTTFITALLAKNQTEVQMLYSTWLLQMPAMSMTKLKYKYHTQENLSTCLCCQRSNWFTNTIQKNTSHNLPVMPKSILKYTCQHNNTSEDQKIKDQTWVQIEYPRISLKLPVMQD